jgi:hypothetical protein
MHSSYRGHVTHITLEQSAHARLITPAYAELPVRLTLRYTSADPFAVYIDFPAHVSARGESATWTFGRALLGEGLGTPAGIGDVRVWPCGWARTVVELHAPQGMVMVRLGTAALHRFLRRSYAVVEPGSENLGAALDHGLTSLLDGV